MTSNLAKKDRTAAIKIEIKSLYLITRKLSQDKKPSVYGVWSKDGKLITEEQEILEHWKEHFEKVLDSETGNGLAVPS